MRRFIITVMALVILLAPKIGLGQEEFSAIIVNDTNEAICYYMHLKVKTEIGRMMAPISTGSLNPFESFKVPLKLMPGYYFIRIVPIKDLNSGKNKTLILFRVNPGTVKVIINSHKVVFFKGA